MQLAGRWYETEEVISLTVDDSRVTGVDCCDSGAVGAEDDWWLAPAFVDLQLNGFAGHNFNRHWREAEQDQATETFRAIVDHAARAGTGMLCPTICTASL